MNDTTGKSAPRGGRRITATLAAAIHMAAPSMVLAQGQSSVPFVKTGYAPVNGLRLYYEIRGGGAPLIVLHGGLSSTEMMADILSALARSRQVIAPDLQAHGRTADIDRPLSAEAMADDIAGLIALLGLRKADVMGYSLGGAVALQTAIRHPGSVRKLVVVSDPCKRDGWRPEALAAMAQMGPAAAEPMKQSPNYKTYAKTAPKPEDWPVLLTKLGEFLRKEYDWSRQVASIQAPTMLVFADSDAVRPDHMIEFFRLLGGGKQARMDSPGTSKARLAILPGLTHYDILSSPELRSLVDTFLDAPMP